MANLHKKELMQISRDYGLELPPSITVPEVVQALKRHLAFREKTQAPPLYVQKDFPGQSSRYVQKDFHGQPSISPAPKITT